MSIQTLGRVEKVSEVNPSAEFMANRGVGIETRELKKQLDRHAENGDEKAIKLRETIDARITELLECPHSPVTPRGFRIGNIIRGVRELAHLFSGETSPQSFEMLEKAFRQECAELELGLNAQHLIVRIRQVRSIRALSR